MHNTERKTVRPVTNVTPSYAAFFKEEWQDITFKLKLFGPIINQIRITPPKGSEEYEYYKKKQHS